MLCKCVCCVPRYVVIDGGTAVEEHNDSNDGRRDQHLCVDPQPGKVQSNLLPEILPVEKQKPKGERL